MSRFAAPWFKGRPYHRAAALLTFLACVVLGVKSKARAESTGPWPVEKANAWQKDHTWLVGCNYIPKSAINELEMWQPDTFDLPEIDRELGWAQSLGFNSVRVFLHNLLWDQDKKGFLKRMDQFLATADKHHIRVLFVLLDSCWDPFPKLGKQRDPRPGVHNSGWVQAPGQDILKDPALQDGLKPYITGVLRRFKNDKRIVGWDLFNEPDNTNESAYGKLELPNKVDLSLGLLKKVVAWAREVGPSQPLTVCVWFGAWDDPAKLTPMQSFSLDNSDVISFHSYDKVDGLKDRIQDLRRFNRPILCTEYMARPQGSTFDPHLGFMKSQGVAAYNWGFVSGKSQAIYPWDSWSKTYTEEPLVWFHDIFRGDGTPYRPEEVAYIRGVTGATAR